MPAHVSQEVLSVLVCPKDRGELSYSASANTLTCNSCKHVYSIENGVPNMLK